MDRNTIVQGAQLKPVLSVRTFGGLAHAGLDVDVTITQESTKQVTTAKLHSKDNQYIADEFFDTANRLGALRFDYTVRCYVVGVGEISFQKTDTKSIGYGLLIDSQARLEVTGKEFEQGETVAIGTDFRFELLLQNFTHDEFVSGDFNVIFTVLDSSLVPIHTKTVDCKTNTAPINFAFTLKASNIPSGALYFRFQVANAQGVHTSEEIIYQVTLPMIATAITFEGFSRQEAPHYKIGEAVRVSIEPATFPDLQTVHALATPSTNQQQQQRNIFMEIKSSSGILLRSIAGKATTGNKYLFETIIEPTLDLLGTSIVSFRYEPASKESIVLANYDSLFGELYEDANALNFTVNAKLTMTDVTEQPETNDFHYGNDISFRFRVKDAVSGKYIEKGSSSGQANIYLELQHSYENRARAFVSAREPAVQLVRDSYKEFAIQWAINPNAVQGLGYLSIIAQSADGNELTLLQADGKSAVRYEVNIGGELNVTSNTYSTSDFYTEASAFVVQFDLACRDKTLHDAQLRCSVVYGDQTVLSLLPVATSVDGRYSVSWTTPHSASPSGKYSLKFYREVDRRLAQEAKQLEEKKRRREEELKQFDENSSSSTTTSSSSNESLDDFESSLQPLFVIDVYHSAPYTGKLPVRTEVVVLLILAAVFFLVSYQKKHYQKFGRIRS